MLVRAMSIEVLLFTDCKLYLVGSLIICVRFRASSLDSRFVEALSMSRFKSPTNKNSEDKYGAISSHSVSRAQLGAEGGL